VVEEERGTALANSLVEAEETQEKQEREEASLEAEEPRLLVERQVSILMEAPQILPAHSD
jgi:hypothetical protein